MKLLRSIGRELILLSRGYYFYIEVAMAALYLVLLLAVMPENIDARTTEYYCFDLPRTAYERLEAELFPGGVAGEEVAIRSRGRTIPATRYATDTKDAYVVGGEDQLIALCQDSGSIGLKLSLDGDRLAWHYYLQGYETERYRNLAALMSSPEVVAMVAAAERQPVRALEGAAPLTDRQNLLVILLVANCALMGILVMAACIFEDKRTNAIGALRVAPAPIGDYLIAKMCAVLLTSAVTAAVVTAPVMGGRANYPLLAAMIVSAGFFTAALGSLLASFFRDMEGAFAAVFAALIALLAPSIGCLIPALDAPWLRLIPSYWALEGVRAALAGAVGGAPLYCCGFLLAGAAAFLPALYRYRHKEAGI